MHVARLAGPTDLAGFRQAARRLVADGVPPADVGWQIADEAADLFVLGAEAGEADGVVDRVDAHGPIASAARSAESEPGMGADTAAHVGGMADAGERADTGARAGPAASDGLRTRPAPSTAADGETDGTLPAVPPADPGAAAPASAAPRVPAFFLPLCESVVLHRDPRRFDLLYRLLWRLQHEPGLRHDPLDADRVQAEQMAQAVRRDIHKMRAFVRFRPVAVADGGGDDVLHVAWFEPEHHIVEANAPFFARRFTQMLWAILTPDRCVEWDGAALHFGPGASRDEAPEPDAGEQLWLVYYQHIFNPARLKLAMMQKEMPRRYWKNLPEAVLIQPLAAGAAERSTTMIEQAPTTPAHRRPAAAGPERPPAPSAGAPSSLAELNEATQRCRECPIGALATQAVPGQGPLAPRLMLVGEQPGDSEDLQGRPFVGPAGQLLDRALKALDWPREELYVTNAVKHFKYELRGKRRLHKTAAQREIQACSHWLESEITLVQPEALVALGATAARSLMGRAVAVTRERGQWLVRADGRRVFITLHPSALLHLPDTERDAGYARWLEDLALARSSS